MERWNGRIALVTGATSGIGASIAVNLAKKGMKVIGCGRRVERIQELNKEHNLHIISYKCDLSNMSEVAKMFDWIQEEESIGHIDLCVCNAGYSGSDSLMKGSPESWTQMMNVNVISVSLATQLSVKMFKEKNIKDGQIVYINSVYSHYHPDLANKSLHSYCATKMANKSLLEMWRREINEMEGSENIKISAISPGLVETEFIPAMFNDKSAQERIAVQEMVKKTMTALAPEDVVNALLYIISTPAHIAVHDVIVRPTGKYI
uniref:Dehydrogenase/reductase SDR family member 11 n=1 Tax=Caligus clemensi TaxID=344056 RepID=C1C2J8_CALCM|nr:Dehydrogenase/reductase SDR family member 11 precursor [Caligus clemensi]